MDSAERIAWAALDALDAEGVAHLLSAGEPLLKRAVGAQMERDYFTALVSLYDEAVRYARAENAPEFPHGVLDAPARIEGAPINHLRSLALEDAELLLNGEADQAYAWALSDGSRFHGQTFRMTEVRAWALSRGLWTADAAGGSSTLMPREKTSLYKVIALLATASGLDLSRHSTAATQLREATAACDIQVGQRTLEKHFRAIYRELGSLRSSPEDD